MICTPLVLNLEGKLWLAQTACFTRGVGYQKILPDNKLLIATISQIDIWILGTCCCFVDAIVITSCDRQMLGHIVKGTKKCFFISGDSQLELSDKLLKENL